MASPRRKRGVILTPQGWEKLQEAKLELELKENSGNRYTREDLSERAGLNTSTVGKILARTEGVDKQTLDLLFKAFNLKLDKGCYSNSDPSKRQDWGEAMSVSVFYGRTEELATLDQWIVNERCRLVALLGMGGIGKTTLSIKFAEQIQDKFEYIIWRSLRDAPPVHTILANLIQCLSDEQETETDLPERIGERLSRLLDYLRKHRCLLVLDNVETILQSGSRAGQYKEGYEGYGELIRRMGEANHQSCLVLTSREKPKEVASLEGNGLPIRSLRLSGLKEMDSQELFKVKGISGSEEELRTLVERYAGNALALKVVATTIQDLFDGNITEFLKQNTTVFGDIRELLDQQFDRLSYLEKDIIYWLAINREPISLSELRSDFVVPVLQPQLLEAVESLGRRTLVERSASLFTLQPVVMEYVTQRLIEQVCEEIVTHSIDVFRCHALIKAQAKDYIRDTQVRLILQPVINGLIAALRSQISIENQLTKILARLREQSPLEPGYTGGNILNLLSQMKTDLRGYDFSYLTIWQADLRGINLHKVNFSHADLAKSVFTKTFGSISSVAFNPDGKILATSDTTGNISLWRGFADGEQLLSCTEHTSWVRTVAFSPDGQTLVSCSIDGTIKLWDVGTGECLKTLKGHTSWIWDVAYSPDGQTLVSGSGDQTIKVWNATTGECLKTLREHTAAVWAVSFSPDGQTLASGSEDQTLKLWDIGTGQVITTMEGHKDWVCSVAFSPDGQTLVSGSYDQTLKLWDVITGKCLKTLRGHRGRIWCVAFSPNGQTLASGCENQTVKLWDANTGECLKTLKGHTGRIWCVTFSPNGQTLASGCDNQTVKLWDVKTGGCLRTSRGYSNGVWSVAVSPDGQTLASGYENQMVKLWDTNTGKCRKTLQGHTHRVRTVAFSRDGQTLASGCDNQTVKLWDVRTGKYQKTLRGHTDCIRTVAFSPDGKHLATGSMDQTVRLWNISTGECLKILKHTHGVCTIAVSPDGQTLASGCEDETLKLWDVNSGQCRQTFKGHRGWVCAVAYSPDGQTLASGGVDQTVKLWDVGTGKCLKTLHGHISWIQSLAYSPDGQTLASASLDQTVKLWDVDTGKYLETLEGHTHWTQSVAFCPNGKMLISGSIDETVKHWDAMTGECLKTLVSEKPYEGMNITGATGLTEATIASLKLLGAVD
ncbi:WD40 domain-containing protein [Coleofasciculus sp.]|uniref:WD40 domain-containing protein n=1 Tax=Coleofasciculus sp. TaxID=3100458 RepID=UPI003A3BCB4D